MFTIYYVPWHGVCSFQVKGCLRASSTNNLLTYLLTLFTGVPRLQMTLSIICAFIGCWTPYFVVHLIHIWSEYTRRMPEWVYVSVETLALVNSAINPILYGCFNVRLERGLAELCCRRRSTTAAQQLSPQHRREVLRYRSSNRWSSTEG